jgi:hypothetical protein
MNDVRADFVNRPDRMPEIEDHRVGALREHGHRSSLAWPFGNAAAGMPRPVPVGRATIFKRRYRAYCTTSIDMPRRNAKISGGGSLVFGQIRAAEREPATARAFRRPMTIPSDH